MLLENISSNIYVEADMLSYLCSGIFTIGTVLFPLRFSFSFVTILLSLPHIHWCSQVGGGPLQVAFSRSTTLGFSFVFCWIWGGKTEAPLRTALYFAYYFELFEVLLKLLMCGQISAPVNLMLGTYYPIVNITSCRNSSSPCFTPGPLITKC